MDQKIYDCIIIGSGPASYSAGLYLAQKKHKNIIMFSGSSSEGGIGPGGQLTTTTDVDNFPGFPCGIQGPDLMENMKKQAKDANLEIIAKLVGDIKKEGDVFNLEIIDLEKKFFCKSIIVGTGAYARKLDVPGSNEYWQRGISSCAVCDGAIMYGRDCAVIGGGDTAFEEAMYLANIANHVYLINRSSKFRARRDQIEKAKKNKKIEILINSTLQECLGDEEGLTGIKILTDGVTESKLDVEGLFFAIGHIPNTKILKNVNVDLHPNYYAVADGKMKSNVEGLFLCGDVQDYKYRQAITAAESGIIAACSTIDFLTK